MLLCLFFNATTLNSRSLTIINFLDKMCPKYIARQGLRLSVLLFNHPFMS